MTKGSAAQEPTMEEILASIRRIISDEETPEAEASAAAADEPPAEMSEEDLDKLFDDPEDGPPAAEAAADPVAEPEEPEPAPEIGDDDILELSVDQEVEETPDLVEAEIGVDFIDSEDEPAEDFLDAVEEAEPEPKPEMAEPEPAAYDYAEAPVEPGNLLSTETDNAVSLAFHDLASTILSNNARTLEDLVKEMLRPMLKSWLDDNLPPLVERLVRAEIERVSRGR
ncbi:MAG: DUF2497 domain-containing protein [Hyphomicrobiales bacterium]|nr:DUF2497 domain-containing protein [Hyphomicrobiales bacterium]